MFDSVTAVKLKSHQLLLVILSHGRHRHASSYLICYLIVWDYKQTYTLTLSMWKHTHKHTHKHIHIYTRALSIIIFIHMKLWIEPRVYKLTEFEIFRASHVHNWLRPNLYSPFFLPRVGNKMVKLTPVGRKGKHNTGEKPYTCDHCEKSFST